MQRVFITLATAIALLWHALVGCCGHHPHPEFSTAGMTAALPCDHDSEHCTDHAAASHGNHHRKSPCEKHACNHGVCQCVAPTNGDVHVSLAKPVLVAISSTPASMEVGKPASQNYAILRLHDPPPLPLHLVYQSLLI
jgi:hypothetical protein